MMRRMTTLCVVLSIGCLAGCSDDDSRPTPDSTASTSAETTSLETPDTIPTQALEDQQQVLASALPGRIEAALATLPGVQSSSVASGGVASYDGIVFGQEVWSVTLLDGSVVGVVAWPSADDTPNPVDYLRSQYGEPTSTWTIQVNDQPVEVLQYAFGLGDRTSVIAGISDGFEFTIGVSNPDQSKADQVAATLYAAFSTSN